MKQKRPATIEELAAISFDVWKPGNGEWKPPVDGQDWVIKLTESIPTLVLAFAVLGRSKRYLMTMDGKIDNEIHRSFIDNIGAWQRYFEGLAAMLSTAETRLMVAMASNIVESEKKKRTRRKAA
jgi:hypothetical protein